MSTLSRMRGMDSPQVAPVSNGPGSFGRTPERARDRVAEHKLERPPEPSSEPARSFQEHATHPAQSRAEVQDRAQVQTPPQTGLERVHQAERVAEQRTVERNRTLPTQAGAAVYSRQGKLAAPGLPAGSLLHACA